MTTTNSASRYMDILAVGLKIIDMFPAAYNQIFAIQNYEEIAESVKNKLDSYWCEDNEQFLKNIEQLLVIIEHESELERKYVMAMEFCRWLDFKITYMQNENNELGERQFFSLYWLIPVLSDCYVEVGALNTNWEKTGIWINPKFRIASPHVKRKEVSIERAVANRDVFEGINGILVNCSYMPCDNKNKVKNIIISNDFMCDKEINNLRIAFSPMSDRSDLIQIKEEVVERAGIKMQGQIVEPIEDAEKLYERLQKDWLLASDVQADIFFAPELLGTEISEENDGPYNDMLWNLGNDRLGSGESVPKLTILPSYWANKQNRATIVGQDGQIIAYQEKHIPFVDIKNNKIEALAELSEWSTVLIHIPGVHRIVIMLCAEFLAKEVQRLQEFLCGSLGATLVIVPSYSRGEQDFINELSSLNCYGTTVIWGNCCGAVAASEKAIGGCGVAGTTKTHTFGKKCTCEFSCREIEACVFLVDIPLDFELRKTEEIEMNELITHVTKRC